MAELLASLWVPLLVLAALPAVGAAARGRARIDAVEWLALACGLVLVWCMAGGMLLGAVSMLHATAVWVWLATGIAGSLAAGWRAGISLGDWREACAGWAGVFLLALPLTVLLLLATVPPWYRDSLIYHLALPRHFAQHGGMTWPDDNIFAAFPIGWESALALLHAIGSSPDRDPAFNPRLVGAWTWGGAAMATIALARVAGAARPLAVAAGVLLLLLPTVVEFGSSAYVEGALLLLVTLALWSALRAGAARGATRGWLLSAVFAGFACWVKYPALIAALFLAAAVPLLETLRRDRVDLRSWATLGVGWIGVVAVVGCPFYLRNLALRGNPLFPSAYALFGGEGWDNWRAWAYGVTLGNYGHGREFADYWLLPWRLFAQRGFEGGFEGSLGPLIALGAPLGLWLVLRGSLSLPSRRGAGLLLAWVAWMSFVWALTVQQARFYLLAVPALLALLGAGATYALRLGERRQLAWLVAAIAIGLQGIWSWAPIAQLWERQSTGQWLAGRLERDALLERMLPETYRATQELEKFVPAGGRVWLVWMRGYTYYLRRAYRIDCVFEAWRLEALLDRSENPTGFGDALRSDGITHLLVNHRFFLQDGNADLRPGRTDLLQRRFAAFRDAGEIAPRASWGPITLYAVAEPNG
jgi:hypothetical protein